MPPDCCAEQCRCKLPLVGNPGVLRDQIGDLIPPIRDNILNNSMVSVFASTHLFVRSRHEGPYFTGYLFRAYGGVKISVFDVEGHPQRLVIDTEHIRTANPQVDYG